MSELAGKEGWRFLASHLWAGGHQVGGGQGTPYSVPYPGVRRRWCRFGVSLRAWGGAWRPHSRWQRGRQGWQRPPAAWGLLSLPPHLRRRGLGGRRRRGGEGRTPGLAATEATWLMGRGLQGLNRVGWPPTCRGIQVCSEAQRMGFLTGGMGCKVWLRQVHHACDHVVLHSHLLPCRYPALL